MTEEEFVRSAETFGADLGRWPAALQRDAADLQRRSATCRVAITEAGELDGWLHAARPVISADRVRDLVSDVLAARKPAPLSALPAWAIGRRSAGIFLASMLLLGLSLGWLGPSPQAAPDTMLDAMPSEGLFGGLL